MRYDRRAALSRLYVRIMGTYSHTGITTYTTNYVTNLFNINNQQSYMFSKILIAPNFLHSVISYIDTVFVLIHNVLIVITINNSQVLARYTSICVLVFFEEG
jgi:hypothetical protein